MNKLMHYGRINVSNLTMIEKEALKVILKQYDNSSSIVPRDDNFYDFFVDPRGFFENSQKLPHIQLSYLDDNSVFQVDSWSFRVSIS